MTLSNRLGRAAAVSVILGGTGLGAALELPVCDRPPRLDGRLDDPAWQQALEVPRLYRQNSGEPAPETAFRLIRDNAWLYLGAHCRNPHMEHVPLLAVDASGPVQNDESIEVLIRPTPNDGEPYYHFLLNFAGVLKTQRCTQAGDRDIGWVPPWRAATRREADGWTAELAIPWFCLETKDLSGLRLNLARNRVDIELDPYGAKQGEKRVFQMLRPDNRGSYGAAGNFVAISGLAGVAPALPFAPRIAAASLTGLRQADGRVVYGVRAELDLATPLAGAVRACVVEETDGTPAEAASRDVELAGAQTVEWDIAPEDWGPRTVRVQLRDPADGNLLAERRIDDTGAIRAIRDAFAVRSYYASEQTADIRVDLGLPGPLLERAALALEAGGRTLSETRGLQPHMMVGLPVSDLAMGEQPVTLRLRLDGAELAAQTVPVVRLEPRPGYEVQVDRLRGVLLKDQQPFFPMGIYGHTLQWRLGVEGCPLDDEPMFRFLAEEMGLNVVCRVHGAQTNIPRFMELAERYGLRVITWTYPTVFWPMNMMRARLGGRVDFTSLDLPESIRTAMAQDPGFWSGIHGSLPTAERLQFRKAIYDRLAAGAAAEAETLRTYPHFLAYKNVDEPNLVNPADRIAAAEWYWNTVAPVDPHRPKYLLYARQIPRGDPWTRWGDILSYDVYTYPYRGTFYNEPGPHIAWFAWQLRERCRQDHKLMWMVPLANMVDPARSPIGLSRAQMLCEAYTAILYGARGLIYFALGNVVGPDAWDALRTIATHVRALTPALVNGDPDQTIRYPPDSFRPHEQVFPMVNAAAFRYPDGQVLLLAVNIRPHAVEAGFRVDSLRSGTRLFAEAPGSGALRIEDGAFQDRFEPYGVRAYRLDLGGLAAPIAVTLEMTACPDERAPEPDLVGTVRQTMMGRNHMPNPCFEQQTNPGVPDFYRPFFCLTTDPHWGRKGLSDWYVDDSVRWNGRPSLRMYRRALTDPGFKTRGLFGSYYPPVSDQPMPLVFSFYARSDKPNATLFIRLDKDRTVGPIGEDWRRHRVSFTLPRGSGDNLGARSMLLIPSVGATIWISGLQVEQGAEPTEFRDDSAPLAPAAEADDPGNLLRNAGAEQGTAAGWQGFEVLRRGEFGVRRGAGRTGEYAFGWRGQSTQIASHWVEIVPSKAYELSGWFRSETGTVSGVVFGLMLADARQRLIRYWNVFSRPGTGTELAAPCRPGDRILRVRDGSAWKPGPSFAAALGVGENALTFDVTPLGIADVRREGADWQIVLKEPCGLERPAGTPVAQNTAGNNGVYLPGIVVSNAWTEWKGRIEPRQWWPGTAFARVAVLGLRPDAGALQMDDFSLRAVE